jgi:phosphoserine phosphatase
MLLSASTQFTVQPVADHISLPFRCTELEVVGDLVTGRIVGQHCYGEGKSIWANRIATERKVDLRECTVYTDSISDKPLMEMVGNPVAINPDRKLKALSKARGWKIEHFY